MKAAVHFLASHYFQILASFVKIKRKKDRPLYMAGEGLEKKNKKY